MHEASIAQELINLATDQMRQHQGQKVVDLKIEIGAFSGVVKDCLEFVFPEMAKGTALENCGLTIDVIPLEVTCSLCTKTSQYDEMTCLCKHCSSVQVTVTKGKEMKITQMEVV